MSNPDRPTEEKMDSSEDSPSPGLNLVLIYSLLALALLAAIGLAALIVLPYYRHR